ncbi:MAG: ABC transporter permease [Firmicutes bacterium]|nr:ABC transporter permease [Bacillota bacterium]
MQVVPGFMLPSPGKVVSALIHDMPLLLQHAAVSLQESFYGLTAAVVTAFFLALLMDGCRFLRRSLYPLLVLSQTVPPVAIAPLLVLWLGYGLLPKAALIFITCFFPLAIGLLTGLQGVDRDIVRLYRSMGANKRQILFQVKLPAALDSFFAGLRIAVAYAIVGAVIAEWLGGNRGLGVYMTRARNSFSYDKMFAVIIVVSLLSLLLIKGVDLLQKRSMPWKRLK